jgi:ribosomal protein L28
LKKDQGQLVLIFQTHNSDHENKSKKIMKPNYQSTKYLGRNEKKIIQKHDPK